MKVKSGKCNILSVRDNNLSRNYCLKGTNIGCSGCEGDLGVLVSADLRHRAQCIYTRNRATKVLGFISMSVRNRSAEVLLKLCWLSFVLSLIMLFSSGHLSVTETHG